MTTKSVFSLAPRRGTTTGVSAATLVGMIGLAAGLVCGSVWIGQAVGSPSILAAPFIEGIDSHG